nr:TolC family protein [Sphingomonas sp.]
MLLTSCASKPDTPVHTPRVTPPARLDAAAANDPAITVTDRWWTAWGDPALDALVEKSLEANADIRAAKAHVAAARALITVAESALYPTVAANGTAWASQSDAGLNDKWQAMLPSLSRNSGSGYLVGLGATWEADLFGGRHADVEMARALSESAARTADAVRLMVAADVVENYQQLQGLRSRLAVLDRSEATAGRLVDYAAARQRTGAATAADVTRARNGLEALRASRPALTSLIDARKRRLAVLAGELPEQVPDMTASTTFETPGAPTGQLPSDILGRRPDVAARSWLVNARAARLKSLKADLLPHFAIHFLGQNGHIELGGLPGYGGTGGLISLSAAMPLFNAGRLQARIKAGDAELEATVANYDQAMLSALEEVESAYSFRTGMDERLAGLVRTSDMARRRAEELAILYDAGRTQLGEVLQARLDALSDEDKVEQSRMAQGTATVQLYRALGGSW